MLADGGQPAASALSHLASHREKRFLDDLASPVEHAKILIVP